jgi:hypothetical protein
MGFFTRRIEVKTDESGSFSFYDEDSGITDSQKEGFNIVAKATLRNSEDATVKCRFHFGHSNKHESREFTLQKEQETDLGSWQVEQGGKSLIGIMGKAAPNSEIAIDLHSTETV